VRHEGADSKKEKRIRDKMGAETAKSIQTRPRNKKNKRRIK
jgi:hypothetical protein